MGLFYSKYQYLEYSNNIQETFPTLVDRKRHYFEKDDGFCGAINGDDFYFYKTYPFIQNPVRTVLYGKIIDDHTIQYRYGKFVWPQVLALLFDFVFLTHLLFAIPRALYERDSFLLTWCAIVLFVIPVVTATFFVRLKSEEEILFRHLRMICGPITIKTSD